MKIKLSAKGVEKSFGNKKVLSNINFDVYNGEFLSILGASGCGKTTLLRIIIGIESLDKGFIEKDNINITNLPPYKRSMGMVFQNYALFPNMSVLQNVMYALKCDKEKKKDAKLIALDIIKKVGLTEHLDKKPHKLSGGQQQRVAIARTLALNPDVILFDEPMSALDVDTRTNLKKEIKEIQTKFNITMVYITHDQEEAFSMSDRIMVMNEGNIMQIGTPNEIYNKPNNEYIKTFVVKNLDEKVISMRNYMIGESKQNEVY